MDEWMDVAVRVAAIGVGATLLMDAWLMLLKRLKVPTLDFAQLGRWLGHALRGRWRHASMAKAAPVRGERALGWLLHYVTGIAFAAMLVAFAGAAWMQRPTLLPALAWGIGTVVAPLFVLQPAMGAGIAAAGTPNPWRNRLRSVANHAVFGAGLHVAAQALSWIG